MAVADGGDLTPDLWEKLDDRFKRAFDLLAQEGVRVQPDGKPRGRAGKRLAAQTNQDLFDRCLICDDMITSTRPYRRAYSIYLTMLTNGGKSVTQVQVHEGCLERGAGLAAEHGYGLEYRDPRNPSVGS